MLANVIELRLQVVDALVQTVRKELVDLGEVDGGKGASGDALGFVGEGPLLGSGNFEQSVVNNSQAKADGAREVRGKEEEGGEVLQRSIVAILRPERGESTARAKDGEEGKYRGLPSGASQSVENAAGLVSTFDKATEAGEVPTFVVTNGGLTEALEDNGEANDLAEERFGVIAISFVGGFGGNEEVDAIQLQPHFFRKLVAHGAGVLASESDAGGDGTGI